MDACCNGLKLAPNKEFRMTLDISPFTRAIQRLDEGMVRYLTDTSDTQIRDGLIQRFEFTYELSHKMLKRYLESASPSPGEFDSADFPYLIRSANERGMLLGDWPQWKQYRDMRAKTSHTYDEDIALAVVTGIPAFQREAHHLHDQILAKLT
jgi:nucleotidyltransferase substrate binding protein (TIGR01987 family)